jgi:diguanylate cyclase (GGDEF)-like protein/PAS domain S-box-containing protein
VDAHLWADAMSVITDPVVRVDGSGRIEALNRAAEHRFGPDVTGRHLAVIVSVSDGDLDGFLADCSATVEPVQRRLLVRRVDRDTVEAMSGWGARSGQAEPDLSLISVRMAAGLSTSDAHGPLEATADALLSANTGRREAQRLLVEQEERFRLAFDASLVGMAIESLDAPFPGRVVRVNDELCRILGRDASEIVGAATADFSPPQERAGVEAVFAELAAGVRDRWDGERHFLRPDGTKVWAHVRKARARASHGAGYLITHFEDITLRKQAEEQLMDFALHDQLTGLSNRILLLDHIDGALRRARRSGETVALLFIDLDNLKIVNDTLGHLAGDEILIAVAKRLLVSGRSSDTAARLGGDEFVILCEGIGRLEDAQDIASRVLHAIGQPITVRGRDVLTTASIGIALALPNEGATPESLMSDADAALYSAKGAGKSRHATYNEGLRGAAVRRLDIEAGLRLALPGNELRVHYQPILDLTEGAVVGAEALVRWQHPHDGLIAPGLFLDVAEESELIVDISSFVLRRATEQLRAWDLSRDPVASEGPPFIAVNVSVRHVASGRLRDDVEAAIGASGLDPARIHLEVTESKYMTASGSLKREIAALTDLGVVLSLDDFGTGYSSLSYLKRFPFKVIKLDRSYVSGIGADKGDEAIVSAVLAIAAALDLDVIAEGVEEEWQLDFLRERGCGLAQGFLFSRPVPADAFSFDKGQRHAGS